MKFILLIITIISAVLFSCTPRNSIVSEVIPAETYDTLIIDKKCAYILSSNFNIAVEELKEEDIKEILNNEIFFNKGNKYTKFRLPKLIFFKIAVENTGDLPLEITDTKLTYGEKIYNSLNADDLKNMFNSPFYNVIDFKELFKLFKNYNEELCGSHADFESEITDGLLKPGNSCFKILAFNYLPIDVRKFNLSVTIKSDIIKKIIDFRMMRFEYRRSGKYFIKPEKDNTEL